MAGDQQKPCGWSFKPGSPEIRGFDTSTLFREECLARIQWLANEIGASQRRINKLESELSEREKQIRRLKKEMGFIEGKFMLHRG